MSLPKPYYETPLGKLYHGDCLEILPTLPTVDLVLTDPPYPGLSGGIEFFGSGVAPIKNKSVSVGEPWKIEIAEWLPVVSRKASDAIFVFCSYNFVDVVPKYCCFKKAALLTWFKRNSPLPVNNVPRFTTEFIWAFRVSSGVLNWKKLDTFINTPGLPGGCMGREREKNEDGTTAHPTQKPTNLICYILSVGGGRVLDPFLGSGTTAVACERLKRQWIGIEIEEKYCEIAAKRIEAERKQLKLF